MGGGSPTVTTTGNQAGTTTYSGSSAPWMQSQGMLAEAMGLTRGVVNQPQSQFPYAWNPGYGNLLQMADLYAPYTSDINLMGTSYAPNSPFNIGAYGNVVNDMGGGTGTGAGGVTGGTGTGSYNISPYGGFTYSPTGTADTAGTGGTSTPTSGAGSSAGDPGYYTNFLTGQSYPYSSYLPYTPEVAPFNPMQTSALGQTGAIAAGGDPVAQSASQMISGTLQGDYLNPSSNPYLQATYQAAAQPVMENYLNSIYPSLRSSAAQAGQFGSSSDALMQGQAEYGLGQTLQSLGTGIYGQNYQAERANQLKAALEAPATSQNMFTYPQAMLSAGNVAQQQQQQLINDMVNQWSAKANYPMTMLNDYISALSGLPISGYGTSSGTGASTMASRGTSTNPYYVSSGNQLLGGLSSLGGLGLGALSILM